MQDFEDIFQPSEDKISWSLITRLTLELPNQSKRLVVYFIKNFKKYLYINILYGF